MATYVLIHGAGDVGWYWHLVERELRTRGHGVVVMDLPVDDDAATLSDYANVVVEAIGDRREDLIVVAQSYGGYVAPIVCDRVPAQLMVLVAAMIPAPRESAEQMFANTHFDDAVRPETDDSGDLAIFYHDVPRSLAVEAVSRGRPQSETTAAEPFPLAAWPDVPTAFILCRHDRLFPAAWLREVVRHRLGTAPEEIDSGHTPALSHPVELTDLLERIRVKVGPMTHVQRYAAFTSDPAGGNPAGVVLEADDLDEVRMQQIAAEVGYSETAFVLRAGRQAPHYGLRFFSPLAEVAFCGHATIATSVALAESGAGGPFRFETRAGEIEVSTGRDAGVVRASLRSVPAHSRPVSSDALLKALDALRWSTDDLDPDYPPQVAYAGNDHLVLATRTRQRLSHLDYDFDALKELCDREGWTTLQLFWPDGDSVFHSRNPFPAGGVVEDPATGAAAAALGAYLRQIERLPRSASFTVVQGEDMGRPSQLHVSLDADSPRVTVSGTAVPIPPALQAPPTKAS